MSKSAKAFAPASVGNVAVGFDILGYSLSGVGDQVEVKRVDQPGVRVVDVVGTVSGVDKIPKSDQNTAAQAVSKMVQELNLPYGFEISIEKNIPLSSGMGGSAASAVAAAVAANSLLDQPHDKKDLIPFALHGEAAASGAAHGDNVVPSLLGGLQLVSGGPPVEIPIPSGIFSVLVHPDVEVDTKKSRGILKNEIPMALWIDQSGRLARFLSGCFTGDSGEIKSSLRDVIIEPQRASLIPVFSEILPVIHSDDSLGGSISGGGPAVFLWVLNKDKGMNLGQKIQKIWKKKGIESQIWCAPIDTQGAKIIS